MDRSRPFLALTLPVAGLKGLPVVATACPLALRAFKKAVLEERECKVEEASSPIEAEVFGLELAKLVDLLDLLIVEDVSDQTDDYAA